MILISTAYSQISTTENFQLFNTSNGLVDNDVKDVLILNDSTIWIATARGLSHFNGATFSNYTTSNSNLANDNIIELVYCQNKIWMITSAGLSSFDGSSFSNYSTSNGLLSTALKGITATSTDTLWMTSTAGSSKFDGTNFTHYVSQDGRDIEVDSSNRVYIIKFANNGGSLSVFNIYENGVWAAAPLGNSPIPSSNSKLVKAASNKFYLVQMSGNPVVYYQISYPSVLKSKGIYFDNSPYGLGSTSVTINPLQFEELNGLKWMGGGTNIPLFHASADSNFVSQYVYNSSAVSSCINAKADILAIGTDSGFYLSKPTLKSNRNGQEFAVNSIRTSVTTTDPLFSNVLQSTSNFEFPKGNNSHGIYSANFIVAAKKVSHSNFEVHPTAPYFQSFSAGPRTTTGGLAREYLVRILKQEIENHKLNFSQGSYNMPDGIKNWPAVGDSTLGVATDLAPFFDANSNGCYDPENGDYPIIKGDEALYWINTPTNQNMELEYHWMMYAFNDSTKKSLDQSIFLQYTIVNRSAEVYDSMKVGMFIDGDLGNAIDDYVGSDSLNNILYFYNGDSFDESVGGFNGYGNRSPALGVKFLSDDLENSIYYNIGTANNGDPTTEQHWLNFMNSKWKNGQPVYYGGDGHTISTTTTPTTHMFTGDPANQTGWTELTPGGGSQPNSPNDRRLFGSIPYFSLQPNERKTIEVAVGYGRTADTSAVIGKNVNEMKSVLNQAGAYWDTLSTPTESFASNDSCIQPTSVVEIQNTKNSSILVYPIPTSGQLTILGEKDIIEIEMFDMKGALLMTKLVNSKRAVLELEERKEGLYFLRILKADNTWETKKIVLMK